MVPKLKQLINLYVEGIYIYPDSVNVVLNVLNSIQANADDDSLSRLDKTYSDALKIEESISREDIIDMG